MTRAGGMSLVVLLNMVACLAAADKYHVYFGTYTSGKSEGIYVAEFDAAQGVLSPPRLAARVKQPSFVALHPSGKFLYAVNESAEYKQQKVGAITAYAIEADGTLRFLNDISSGGAGPCHVNVDRTGKFVVAANYGGGSVTVVALRDDGGLDRQTGFNQHTGSSVNPARQKEPHAHSANLDAANRFLFVADLGLDKILTYKFDSSTGSIEPNEPPFAISPAGGGPRHFAFNPRRPMAYACNELLSSVTTYTYNPQQGELVPVQTVSTLPPETTVSNSTAEVCVHPGGKFVYVSNRGHNSIAAFRVDEKSGRLTPTGHATAGIAVPRNFCLEPEGRWALVANQQGDSVLVFRIDPETGLFEPTPSKIEIGSPVCVRFLPVE